MLVVPKGTVDVIPRRPVFLVETAVEFAETAPCLDAPRSIVSIQALNHGINYAHGVVLRNVFVNPLREKHHLVGRVGCKV